MKQTTGPRVITLPPRDVDYIWNAAVCSKALTWSSSQVYLWAPQCHSLSKSLRYLNIFLLVPRSWRWGCIQNSAPPNVLSFTTKLFLIKNVFFPILSTFISLIKSCSDMIFSSEVKQNLSHHLNGPLHASTIIYASYRRICRIYPLCAQRFLARKSCWIRPPLQQLSQWESGILILTARPPAACLPTPESPSMGCRKSTKVISELQKKAGRRGGREMDLKEGTRASQPDTQTQITEFIKTDPWRRWGVKFVWLSKSRELLPTWRKT